MSAAPAGHRALPTPGTVRWGDLDEVEPISRAFGGDRGTPVDRYYIKAFLDQFSADIKGHVAEIGDNAYTRRFGADKVTRSDIIDAPGSSNPHATLRVDLQAEDSLAGCGFDCLIVTQTLHMIYDLRGALGTIHRSLAPGGTVLATVPGITSIDAYDGPEKWFWAMTQSAARRLFAEQFEASNVQVFQYGNVLAATAFLQGLAFEELDPAKLDIVDPLYPVITGIRAVKALVV
ncbi:hypothetical protein [Mesorhizobium sp. 113-3-9]|uniref:hypothetical protein n=1 Tax=Mesorhizobium sp. 113-3-9 TaxID=2744517 RepID=UPI001927F569|nr:hypothetical protein [Mesorhizobium sp. 113-3-9]